MIHVHLIDKMGSDLTVVNAARISFANQAHYLVERDIRLLDYLAKNEHMSPFEHCSMTVMIECPLYIRSQIHRHRTFAYNEVSRRYTADDLAFYFPPIDDIRKQSKSNKQASDGLIGEKDATDADTLMRDVVIHAETAFNELLSLGVAREQARAILPQNLMTKFYMTGNLRNWAHFVRLRDHSHAQKEVQVIGKQVKLLMLELFPEASNALFTHQSKT
jgi:thymidylate synthase (FAD)